MARRSWRVKGLAWRLSYPGFDPGYGKLICQATLMSSDRTKQICLWMTIDLSIYIYIYILTNLISTSIHGTRKKKARQKQEIKVSRITAWNDGFRINLEYREREESNSQKRRNRPRKMLGFNPPYNMEVVNNLGKEFFKLLKRSFPSGNPLHKIFNKNCVKLSFSCMPNINGIINKSNRAKLSKEKNKVIAKCNCRDKVRCPLEGKCKQECEVYKVEVYRDPNNKRNKKIYFGSTQGDFKTRYFNHKTIFSHEKYSHSTTLSSYVWELKDNKEIDPIMKWEVMKKCRKYWAWDRSCLLCKEEKLAIASCKSRDMLNQRSEVLNSSRQKSVVAL